MGFALSTMHLKSPAFEHGGRIPTEHTGEGKDVSPALEWGAVPDGTKAFALICHDPDAPLILDGTYGFVHWVLYNIPGSVTKLEQGVTRYTNGMTSFGKDAYGGPMPPPGHGTHQYYFWLFALSEELSLASGLTLWELLAQIEPNVLGMNRLVGTYSRS